MSELPSLWERMRAHPQSADMSDLADKLETVFNGFYIAEPQTHTAAQFVGAWARARKKWCEVTGEPLI